jgi:UDP-N-acetyl-D-mannosaminuronate dehydrogenase
MKTTKRRFLSRIAVFGLALLALPAAGAAGAAGADSLGQDTLETLDNGLSETFARPMRGQILYQDQQSVVLTIGIKYTLAAADRGADWADKLTRLLRNMGAAQVQASDSEVRAEKLPIADRQAVATHFNATSDALEVVVIFLEP